MTENIYGVDKGEEYGPKEVLQATENCFVDAHREVIDSFVSGLGEVLSEEDKEKIRKMDVHYMIKNFIEKAGGDYDNPTKGDLQKLIDQLKVFAENFRRPDVVEKNYNVIKGLIDGLK